MLSRQLAFSDHADDGQLDADRVMGPVIVHHLRRDAPEPAGPRLDLGGGVILPAPPAPGYICRFFWTKNSHHLFSLDDDSNAAPLRDVRMALLSQAGA